MTPTRHDAEPPRGRTAPAKGPVASPSAPLPLHLGSNTHCPGPVARAPSGVRGPAR